MPGKGRQIYFSCREERDNRQLAQVLQDSLEDMVEMVPTNINEPMIQQGPPQKK